MPVYCHLSCLTATWPPPCWFSISCYNQYVTCRGFVTWSALPRLLSSHLPNHLLHSIHTGLWGRFWDVPGWSSLFAHLSLFHHLAASEDIVFLENSFIMALSMKASMCPATVLLMTLLCLFWTCLLAWLLPYFLYRTVSPLRETSLDVFIHCIPRAWHL